MNPGGGQCISVAADLKSAGCCQAPRLWAECLLIDPLPFILVAAAESEVELPVSPVDMLGALCLATGERLHDLNVELGDLADGAHAIATFKRDDVWKEAISAYESLSR